MKEKLRWLRVYLDLLKFSLINRCLGFDQANAFLRRVGKQSIQPILKKHGAKIGNNCDIEVPLLFHNCRNFSNLTIGNNVHLGKGCFFDLKDRIDICDNTVVSMQTTVLTHIDLGQSSLSEKFPNQHEAVSIKQNCYIGANVTILMGVIMGEASIAAAGAVIIKNVRPGTMVGGVPAKEIVLLTKR